MTPVPEAPVDPGNRLARLVALRWVVVAAELALVLLTDHWLDAGIGLVPVLAICLLQVGWNLATLAFAARVQAAGDGRLLAQLLCDVAALTAIAYLAGGSTNPLIGLYLLWVAAGATMLSARPAAALAAVSIACYSLVCFVHAPQRIADHERLLQVHLAGMWLIFVISAVTICWSVARLTSAVRRRDAQLATAREAALRNERVVALGNLAAGAAHELGTPLATIAVLVGELLRAPDLGDGLRPDLALVQAQVDDCKRIITELAAQAGTARAEALAALPVHRWLTELVQRWRLQRPVVQARLELEQAGAGPMLMIDATVSQALIVLFNNAADASPDEVQIHARWTTDELFLDVHDRGAGIASAVEQGLGRDLVTTRADGLGMGLVLAFAAIERSGGSLAFAPRAGGGTTAQVRLPLAPTSVSSTVTPMAGQTAGPMAGQTAGPMEGPMEGPTAAPTAAFAAATAAASAAASASA
jgi:two-component system sensor histidine kinase RegB